MHGYPKWLNTKFDYEYVADNFPKEQWSPDWQALLDDMYQWISTGYLDYRSEGIEDETHRIEPYEREDGTTGYVQLEYKLDDHARIFQLGFTEEEVRNKLSEPE